MRKSEINSTLELQFTYRQMVFGTFGRAIVLPVLLLCMSDETHRTRVSNIQSLCFSYTQHRNAGGINVRLPIELMFYLPQNVNVFSLRLSFAMIRLQIHTHTICGILLL